MTVPNGAMGAARDGSLVVGMVVDGSTAGNQFRRQLDNLARGTKKDQDRVGMEIGRTIHDGVARNAFEGLGSTLSARIATGVLGSRRRFRRVGTSIVREIADGLVAEGNLFNQVLGGLIGSATQTIGPILGSIFNVSGRNPAMLVFIVVLIGALVALILGLVHGLHALASVLAVIPNLLFAIGLQAGALIFIFNGFFEAVGNLAAVNSIEELNEALKDTNPAMAAVIKTLFPFKQLFKDISEASKTSFFGAIGDTFSRLYTALTATNSLMYSMTTVAGGLGRMVATVLDYFTTSEFNTFLKSMADATARWLDGFGPALQQFIAGLTRFGIATLPYVEWFGTKFNEWIASIGRWFDKLGSPNSEFLDWIERAKTTLSIFGDVLGEIWRSFKVFLKNLESAGGDKFLERIGEVFKSLNEVFDSDFGRMAMQGLIRLTLILLALLGSLIIAVGSFLAIFNALYSGVKAIGEGFVLLGRLIGEIFNRLEAFLWDWIWRIGYAIVEWFYGIGRNVGAFLTSIPSMIIDAFRDARNWLFNAGVDLVQGLINGALTKLGPLGSVIKSGISKLGLGSIFGGGGGSGEGGGGEPAVGGGGFAGLNNAVGVSALQGPTTVTSNSNRNANVNMAAGAVQISLGGNSPVTFEQAKAIGDEAAKQWVQAASKLVTASARQI